MSRGNVTRLIDGHRNVPRPGGQRAKLPPYWTQIHIEGERTPNETGTLEECLARFADAVKNPRCIHAFVFADGGDCVNRVADYYQPEFHWGSGP